MSFIKDEAQLSPDDLANLRYLALHRIPETLEKLTKMLIHERPDKPLPSMVKLLTKMRIDNKTRNIEDYMQKQTDDPNYKISTATAREIGKHCAPISSSDRDESIRSESSTFSVNSVDMADFLQEFRQAYSQHMRNKKAKGAALQHPIPAHGRLTKADLGEIIDYVAFPTPDKMLTDMFNEIDIDQEGSVEFEVFLARMCYKIQGRFGTDILKVMFRSVALDNNILDIADVPRVFHKLGIKIQEKELADLCARYAAAKGTIAFDEFQRMAHHHTAANPAPTPSSMATYANRDLEDE
eukprot:NODE_3954_length_1137_cov_97.787968_g3762_i0.p1 GENE.NODE_3954_length_1137_cov_97.787968_g3762_i0~~NODE_3954_length_1137_cov_97.787968_g3762_i0.p1  ORF type:complete len:296 (+),score=46.48 NODE_3954_length_1137_cov_97.787968_g3762_i0:67-954(+)